MFKLTLLTSSLTLLTASSTSKTLPSKTSTKSITNNKKSNVEDLIHSEYSIHENNINMKFKHIEQYGNKQKQSLTSLNQPTFDSLLSEINLTKDSHGKILSPEVYNKLMTPETNNLRSLSKKNNFIELAVFQDLGCMEKSRAVGRLVNYCYNEWESSYLFKVNRKVLIDCLISYLISLIY